MESDATGVFNLGRGKNITLNELIGVIENVVGKEANKKYIEKQKGDVLDTWANIMRAKKTFDYNPKVNIKEGTKLFYNWFEKCYQ
jgi:nucleoside-diphosphate-sugar epimerase